jgi:phosphate transport system substrate-binding protein
MDGTSSGAAISKLAAEEFQKTRKEAFRFAVGISGSGGGLRKLCGNEIDLAVAARPISREEISACQKADAAFIELPIAFDTVTVVVNPRNSFVQSLTLAELRTMWGGAAQGKIVRWSQVNTQFPNAPLKLLGPDSRYEQASVFTEAILGQGQRVRRDYMTSVDDEVLVQGVARDVNTLSYISYPTYLENRGRLKVVPVVSGATGAKASTSPEVGAAETEGSLRRPLFLYVNVKSLERPLVRDFVEFTLANGVQIAKAARYRPLTGNAYRLGLAHVRNLTKGSAWDGSVPVGITAAEVEKRLAAL